jgi:hypothetical protein
LGVPILDFISSSISNLWTGLPKSQYDISGNYYDLSGNDISGNNLSSSSNEVFHISDNIYTYSDAQSVCSSFGAKLATYDQINEYYNKGGEFCGYGWSEDQMALFPTQKSTWNALQKGSKGGVNNQCGRPGINGGILDPNFKFGVNCYGPKPIANEKEMALLHASTNGPVIPKTAEQLAIEQKVGFFNQFKDKMNIASFNGTKWNQN